MQNPPSPEAVAKFRTYCKPPEELVKLLKDVGSCTVEIKMATVSPSRQCIRRGWETSSTYKSSWDVQSST